MLEWLSEETNREEMREVQRHLRCSLADAALLLMLGQVAEGVDALGMLGWIPTGEDSDEQGE